MLREFDIEKASQLARDVTAETLHGPLPLETSVQLACDLLAACEYLKLFAGRRHDDDELPEGLPEGFYIHLVGPDDVIASCDELTALRQANEFNIAAERQRREFSEQERENHPLAVAVVRKR